MESRVYLPKYILSRCQDVILCHFFIKNKIRLKYMLLYIIYMYLFYFDEPWNWYNTFLKIAELKCTPESIF